MKSILLLILVIAISCQPSVLLSKEERMNRQKVMKEKFIQCLKENGSKKFIEFVEQNESNLRYAIAKNKKELSKDDKIVVKNCKSRKKKPPKEPIPKGSPI